MEKSNEILKSYLRLTQHMSQQFRSYFSQLNLTFPQALVLSSLVEEDAVPISALAERTGSANSTVSGIVDRLETLGLVKRTRSETDHRVVYVSTTPKYRRMHKATQANVNGYFHSLMDTLGEKDQEMILQALNMLDGVLTHQESE